VRTRKYQDDGGDLSDDSDLRSSPARGAALALASMNRQKPGVPVGLEIRGEDREPDACIFVLLAPQSMLFP
jgi:hypothetical protein